MDGLLLVSIVGAITLLYFIREQSSFTHLRRALKACYARLLLFWSRPNKKRLLDVHDFNSRDVQKFGLVASELEKQWDSVWALSDDKSLDKLSFYGLDDSGTYLAASISRQLNRAAIASLSFALPDGTTYQLPENYVSNVDPRDGYNGGGLKFQLLEPMRRWRIVFNGFVKRTRNGKTEEVVLRINLLWTSFSRPFEFKREFSNSLMAKSLSRETWSSWASPPKPYGDCDYDGVDQWGAFFGTFNEMEEKEIYLRGLRQKRWGQENHQLKQALEVIGSDREGNYFFLIAKNESMQHEVHGHVYRSSGFLHPIDDSNLALEEQVPSDLAQHAIFRFKAAGKEYQAISSRLTVEVSEPNAAIYPGELTFNSFPGRVMIAVRGKAEKQTINSSLQFNCIPKRKPTNGEAGKLVLLFDEESCRFDELVGGKGASLAVLSSNVESSPIKCTVPLGFCVTIAAWKTQTRDEKLQSLLKQLEGAAKNGSDLKESCEKASKYLAETPVNSFVKDCIREALLKLFGDVESKQFAVRSSAIGEDSEELSSAGQNVTVLGCRGFESVLNGLQRCWASLLAYQSVEYRRQHGEPIVPGMGVVIQEMVDAESAGVLFTVNPNDGDPSKMILTANFGLGESVVSASADPDTIVIKRTSSEELSISERQLGTKHAKIVLAGSGTCEQHLNPEESSKQCLSDDIVLKIAQLGLHLEKLFGGPRDVEFAVSQNHLYLLQARPVTSLDRWTDFELTHEFDTPLISNSEYVTKANTGEVLPGSGTPLSISFSHRSMDMNFQTITARDTGRLYEVNPWCMGRFTPIFCNQAFLNIVDMFRRDIDKEPSNNDKSIDMAVFGHLVVTEEMHNMGLRRYGAATLYAKFHRFKAVFMDLFFNNRRLRSIEPIYWNYTFPVDEYNNSRDLYGEITRRMPIIIDIGEAHMKVSRASGTAQMIAFLLLLDGSNDWNSELYGDIAKLLTSISDVESADVPVALKILAKAIVEDEGKDTFLKLTLEDGASWLATNKRKPGKLYEEFIKRHGHRGVKEFDLITETWALNPKGLIQALQAMVANGSSFREPEPVDWQKSLPSLKPSKLRTLKFFVPKSRAAVVAREKTKSMLIRTIHVFRMAYRKLAELLVKEGKIPDVNLIFFLTHSEIGDLIESKSNGIVSKAKLRRKQYPVMDALKFPEISKGIPVPVTEEEVIVDVRVNELSGTPVYRGKVRAVARVAMNLDEAKEIQSGDVLITRSTDIGWSPYFPLLSGVVTELGGLISHGAVVAREYGLPAIVGCANATQVFKSGDLVLLDGTKGTITKLSERKMDEMD